MFDRIRCERRGEELQQTELAKHWLVQALAGAGTTTAKQAHPIYPSTHLKCGTRRSRWCKPGRRSCCTGEEASRHREAEAGQVGAAGRCGGYS